MIASGKAIKRSGLYLRVCLGIGSSRSKQGTAAYWGAMLRCGFCPVCVPGRQGRDWQMLILNVCLHCCLVHKCGVAGAALPGTAASGRAN